MTWSVLEAWPCSRFTPRESELSFCAFPCWWIGGPCILESWYGLGAWLAKCQVPKWYQDGVQLLRADESIFISVLVSQALWSALPVIMWHLQRQLSHSYLFGMCMNVSATSVFPHLCHSSSGTTTAWESSLFLIPLASVVLKVVLLGLLPTAKPGGLPDSLLCWYWYCDHPLCPPSPVSTVCHRAGRLDLSLGFPGS